MKSSAVSIYFTDLDSDSDYLVNVIDSPGHVDFSSEVSTAVRLCDGAVVVVDVVEGVQPQTKAVLQQAWQEGIKPVLVLNKLDRLIGELKMDPLTAYVHLAQVVEQVNAVLGELFAAGVMLLHEEKLKDRKKDENKNNKQVNRQDMQGLASYTFLVGSNN
jgi:ribosome assembly protein 1